MSRYRAPKKDGEQLIDPPWSDVPLLIEANRGVLNSADFLVSGRRLSELRRAARQELAPRASFEKPLLLTGHQPELCHPGVWLKTFQLGRFAKTVQAETLNLVVDTDDIKSLSVRVPRYHDDPALVQTEHVAFDVGPTETPYETRQIQDVDLFRSFGERAGVDPELWRIAIETDGPIGERFVRIRTLREEQWGCVVPRFNTSQLSRSEAFQAFVSHVMMNLPRFAESHNRAVRDYRIANKLKSATHPVPELKPGEAPFWTIRDGQRRPARTNSDLTTLRPRALTLTLFARLILGDWFVHGIGGGKYDEVTDAIIRDFFGIEAPAFQVITGTKFLPYTPFPDADLATYVHTLRDLEQNPQRYLAEQPAHIQAMMDELQNVIATRPETKPERRERRLTIERIKAMLRSRVDDHRSWLESETAATRIRATANHHLFRRDLAWVLYPEATLKTWLNEDEG